MIEWVKGKKRQILVGWVFWFRFVSFALYSSACIFDLNKSDKKKDSPKYKKTKIKKILSALIVHLLIEQNLISIFLLVLRFETFKSSTLNKTIWIKNKVPTLQRY